MNPSTLDIAVLIARIALGGVFIFHGGEKFGLFGGPGHSGLVGMMKSQNVAFAPLMGLAASLSELVGGVMVLLGLLTPLGGALIISTMIVAIHTVHWQNGFSNTKRGYEYNLVLSVVAFALVLLGAGSISLDQQLGIAMTADQLPAWAWLALVLVMVGGIGSYELLKRVGVRQTA
jgi:putative oxidoreductase